MYIVVKIVCSSILASTESEHWLKQERKTSLFHQFSFPLSLLQAGGTFSQVRVKMGISIFRIALQASTPFVYFRPT